MLMNLMRLEKVGMRTSHCIVNDNFTIYIPVNIWIIENNFSSKWCKGAFIAALFCYWVYYVFDTVHVLDKFEFRIRW